VEPYDAFREGLAARGYRAYAHANDAVVIGREALIWLSAFR
jgi:hypothetical protein